MLRGVVQSTVGRATKLLLNVTPDSRSSSHTIQGWEGEYTRHFSKSLHLEPSNNQPTLYTITVSYESGFVSNATANSTSPDGTSYALKHHHTVQLQTSLQH